MSENSALAPAPRQPAGPINSLQEVLTLGDWFAKSGFFADARSPAQAVVKILAGRELGFPAIASMTGVHIIEGKPSVGAGLLAAAIRADSRYDYDLIRADRQACELEFFENAGRPDDGPARKGCTGWKSRGRIAMTLQEAHDSGITLSEKTGKLKRNWKTSSDDMLFARVVTKGYRRHFPDLARGVLFYDPDELDHEITPSGQVIPAQCVDDAPPPSNGEIIDAGYTTPNGTQVGMDETTLAPGGPDPNAPTPASASESPAITDEQRASLVETARQKGRPTANVSLILSICGAKSLDRLPQAKYPQACRLLNEGLATSDQVDRITRTVNDRKIPWDSLAARLTAKYGVKSLAHLTPGEAEEVEEAFRPKAPTPA